MNNACVSAKPLKAIPVARAYDVFDRLRKQYYDWVKLRELWMQLMEKYMVNAEQRLNDLLRKKIRQWRDKAKKMTEEAAKRRIAKWLEERYRIANARKNWIDLATKYDLFCNNRLLYEIRRRLAQFAKARDMIDRLRFRFTKTGKDQFTDGIKFISFLRFLKQLVENWDERNGFRNRKYRESCKAILYSMCN